MSSEKIQFTSYGQAVDGTMHCSAVETRAENLMQDSDKDCVICFPSPNRWATMRSSGYRMTTENVEMHVPVPIYRVQKVLLKVPDLYIETDADIGMSGNLTDFIDDNGNNLTIIDITDYVCEKTEWNALPLSQTPTISEDVGYLNGVYKDNTLSFTQGVNNISVSGEVYDNQRLNNWGYEKPVYYRILESVFYQIGEDYWIIHNGAPYCSLKTAIGFGRIDNLDPREWLFRIEYVPLISATKLRARKAEKTNVEYIQPYNQRAEYNAVSAFGKSMYLTAQKTGVPAICVVKNYRRLADIPPLGSLVRYKGKKYRLVVNSYSHTNTVQVQVTHTLSENWTYKSNFVSIDQKYRNYEIPQDLLWRNLYFEDYVVINKDVPRYRSSVYAEDKSKFSASAVSTVFYPNVKADGINVFTWFLNGEDAHGITLPLSTYGMGNSLVFSCSFKDNVSAGLKDGQSGTCSDAFYCDDNGTLAFARVVLSVDKTNYRVSGLGTANEERIEIGEAGTEDSDTDNLSFNKNAAERARWLYPSVGYLYASGYGYDYLINYPVRPIYENVFLVEKQAGEALKFTYQLHFVPHDSDIVLGEALTSAHPAVKRTDDTGMRAVYFFSKRVREGEKNLNRCLLRAYSVEGAYTVADDKHDNGVEYFTIELGGVAKSILTKSIEEEQGIASWAIVGEGGEILIACNDITCTKLVFELMHKR